MQPSFIYRLFFLLITLCSFSAQAQPYDPDKISKKAMTLYTQAQQRAEDGNFVIAAGLLGEAIATDKNFVEAYLALAVIYGKLKNYPESISTYEKAFAIDTAYTIDFKPAYAAKLAGNGEFEKALAAINDYLSKRTPKNPTTIEKINNGKKWLVLIDELFKGTNVQDAMKCSLTVIKGLIKIKNSLFILSTHLYEIGEELKPYPNISFRYFETNVTEDQLSFSYQLREGISNDRIGYVILKREKVVDMLEKL